MRLVIRMLAAMAVATAMAAAQTVDLKGKVVDKADGRPIPGATVKVTGSALTATTDSAGNFRIQGTVGLRGGSLRRLPADPYVRDGSLHVDSPEDGLRARVEIFGADGLRLGGGEHALVRGWNRLAALPARDFLGFARITVDGNTWVRRVLHVAAPARASWSSAAASAPARKASAAGAGPVAGTVEITVPKLLPKTVAFASDVADLGTISPDYPPRKLDVGALPVYGAYVLFDGSKGRAAAQAELQAKWQDWPRYTPSDIKFRLAKDPQYPNDTNRVTVQSCCNTLWGYDDIQAKRAHGDAQLHVEWIGMGRYDSNETPDTGAATKTSPAYINSGVYVQSRYEVQIESPGVSDAKHTMASLVDDYAADSQAPNRGNGKWQAYDITFRAARYDASGNKLANARITVWWNGVVVHDNRDARAPATGLKNHSGEELNPTLYGLKLQSEGRDVRFRNIWIKDLDIKDPQTKFGY